MKINYHNEDCNSSFITIIVLILFMSLTIVWGLFSTNFDLFKNFSFFIFLVIIELFFLIPLIFEVNIYNKRKMKRNLNIFIMKNGIKIKGKVISIWNNYTPSNTMARGIHDVTARVSYNLNCASKEVLINDLAINLKRINMYLNKEINVYIYNNMKYIDIVN